MGKSCRALGNAFPIIVVISPQQECVVELLLVPAALGEEIKSPLFLAKIIQYFSVSVEPLAIGSAAFLPRPKRQKCFRVEPVHGASASALIARR